MQTSPIDSLTLARAATACAQLADRAQQRHYGATLARIESGAVLSRDALCALDGALLWLCASAHFTELETAWDRAARATSHARDYQRGLALMLQRRLMADACVYGVLYTAWQRPSAPLDVRAVIQAAACEPWSVLDAALASGLGPAALLHAFRYAAALPDCPAYHAQFAIVERATTTPAAAWLALFRRQVETIAPHASAR